MCVCVCMYVCMYVYMYVCMYACMYVCNGIYTPYFSVLAELVLQKAMDRVIVNLLIG